MKHLSPAAPGEKPSGDAPPFGRIFETLPHNALVLSPSMVILAVSDAYLESTLTRRERIVGRYVFDVFPDNPNAPQANAVSNLKASLERVLRTGQPHQMPVQHYDVPDPTAPGQFVERHWSALNTPVLDDRGEVVCIVHLVTNVTEAVKTRRLLLESQAHEERGWAEARQAGEALQESEERFKTMADASGILIAYTDAEDNAIYFNREWLRLTGRTMDQLIHSGWADLFHPDDRDGFLEAYVQAFRNREVLRREFRLRDRQGEYRWQLAVVSPRFRPDGTYAGHLSSSVDITDLKAAQRALAEKNAELTGINNDLDNFVYAASHDLKAPIHNIEGLMKVLISSIPPESMQSERVANTSRMILESVERFKRTIGNLTEITKLQKEAYQPAKLVPQGPLIEEVILDLGPAIEASGANIRVDVDECPMVSFSEKNLRSILYNLLSNALKYRSPDRPPRVHISCRESGPYQVLAVTDNGLGIDLSKDRQREKLFGMFKRLHTHVEGTGVGLYMVKKMIDNAGGKIEVESRLGEGSTFRVYFRRQT